MRKLLLLVALFGILAISAGVNAQESLPSKDALEADSWNRLEPGGETTCSRGTDYAFYVHPGDESKLMIHFQGGGACWNGLNCSKSPLQTFDEDVAENELDQYTYGIFDFENEANPVGDYTTVVVTYCTADIHVGDAVVDHDGIEIHHNGVKNAQAVLDWVYENYPDPSSVFVNGCSAGAYGSIFFAPQVAETYPDATFSHLGDSGIGVIAPDFDGLEKWGFYEVLGTYFPNLADIEPAEFDGTVLYQGAAELQPEKFFTEFTSLEDQVQISFYQLMGGLPQEWTPQAQTYLDSLDALPNFAYFTNSGAAHCILPFPEFYEVAVNEVALVDWVTSLISGEAVESVSAAK